MPIKFRFACVLLLGLLCARVQGETLAEPYGFTTLAGMPWINGTNDGPRTKARLETPRDIARDLSGNLYFTDGHAVRRVDASGNVTTIAGRPNESSREEPRPFDVPVVEARFHSPSGLAVDRAGNIFVADSGEATIRLIGTNGIVTTVAGRIRNPGNEDGLGSAARFSRSIGGLALDANGILYVADSGNWNIRKINPEGQVTTFAGSGTWGRADGVGTNATFTDPRWLALTPDGTVYVAAVHSAAGRLRKIEPDGTVSTLPGFTNEYSLLAGIGFDAAGHLFVADAGLKTISKVTSSGEVRELAGLFQLDQSGSSVGESIDGVGTAARFSSPAGMVVEPDGTIYLTDSLAMVIRKGSPPVGPPRLLLESQPTSVTVTYDASLEVVAHGAQPLAYKWRKGGALIPGATNAQLRIGGASPSDAANYTVEIANEFGSMVSTQAMRVLPPYTFTTLAGESPSSSEAGVVTTLGKEPIASEVTLDGTGWEARFGRAHGVAVDASGQLFVADAHHSIIRKITPEGLVTTFAGQAGQTGNTDGTGSEARFASPTGVALDSVGNLYVADTDNHTIRKITPEGRVSTLAGFSEGDYGQYPKVPYADGIGSQARFAWPRAIAVGPSGDVYVGDAGLKLRKISPEGAVTSVSVAFEETGLARGGFEALCLDADGNLYAVGYEGDIWKVPPGGGKASLVSEGIKLWPPPPTMAVDSAGNLFLAGTDFAIRRISPDGMVQVLAGVPEASGSADGVGRAVRFGAVFWEPWFGTVRNFPLGLAVDRAGNLYVADHTTIRKGVPTPMIESAGFIGTPIGRAFSAPFTAHPGQTVVFETSEDLKTWEPYATTEVGSEPPSLEHYNVGKSKAFYRVRVQTPTTD